MLSPWKATDKMREFLVLPLSENLDLPFPPPPCPPPGRSCPTSFPEFRGCLPCSRGHDGAEVRIPDSRLEDTPVRLAPSSTVEGGDGGLEIQPCTHPLFSPPQPAYSLSPFLPKTEPTNSGSTLGDPELFSYATRPVSPAARD